MKTIDVTYREMPQPRIAAIARPSLGSGVRRYAARHHSAPSTNGGWHTESIACRLLITFAGDNASTNAAPIAATRLRNNASATTKISATLITPPITAIGARTVLSVNGNTSSVAAIE